MTLDEIGRIARDYADSREALEAVVEEVRAVQRAAVRERMRTVRARVARTGSARDRLRDAIDESRALFRSQRTQSLHGIKFGLRKSPGRLEGDQAEAIARIERRHPARAADLIRVKKELNKSALAQLQVHELAALGVSLVQPDDQIVISAASSDLDKLVAAMLEEDPA